MAKGNRKLKLTVLGFMLLGLWEMLALMQGVSVGMEARYLLSRTEGFGETRRTLHPLDQRQSKGFAKSGHKTLPAICLGENCAGAQEVVETALLDMPVDDGADDATSAIGPGRAAGTPPSVFTASGLGNAFPSGSPAAGAPLGGLPGFGPLGFGGPVFGGPGLGGPAIASSNPSNSANCSSSKDESQAQSSKQAAANETECDSKSQGEGTDVSNGLQQDAVISNGLDIAGGTSLLGQFSLAETSGGNLGSLDIADIGLSTSSDGLPPLDFSQSVFALVDATGGSGGAGGSNGPDGPLVGLSPPVELPEPLTVSLFVTGLAGSVLLRRRSVHSCS